MSDKYDSERERFIGRGLSKTEAADVQREQYNNVMALNDGYHRQLKRQEEEIRASRHIIAILVNRLGGEVTISDIELEEAESYTLIRKDTLIDHGMILRAARSSGEEQEIG